MVADSDDVGMCPDIEPSQKTEDQGDKGVGAQLWVCQVRTKRREKEINIYIHRYLKRREST